MSNPKYRNKAFAIVRGDMKDDYTNHMLSHFGWYMPYEDQATVENDKKYYKTYSPK
jgi:hypothetical protein